MQLDLWYIQGESFHFGRHGMGQEESSIRFPSDSLFAALIARMAVLYGSDAVDQFVRPFKAGQPPFVLSSALPRAGDVLFFPPPQYRPDADESARKDGPGPKRLKRIKYVSQGVFQKLLGAETMAHLWDDLEKVDNNQLLLTSTELSSLPKSLREERNFWTFERRPHAALGRSTPNAQIFHTGRTVFNHDCGLWFGVRWFDPSPDMKARLETIFRELGDAGLGGERSRGYGKCCIALKRQLNLPDSTDNAPWLTLSRYLPKNSEETVQALKNKQASYRVETVQGWVNSPGQAKAQRRRTINVLTEGSVLGPVTSDVPGQMVDVRPHYDGQAHLDHPVWRNGFALAVGLTKEAAA